MFSIITVCLNNREGLIRTFDSIKKQAYCNFEWIVIDGGSTDKTVGFLKEIESLYVIKKLQWISEPDDGLYDAMNKGLKLSNSGYLLFLNSGDVLSSSSVLESVEAFCKKRNYPDFVYGDAYDCLSNGEVLYKTAYSHRRLWYGMFTHHQAMFYKLSLIKGLKYRLVYSIAADYAFTSEFLKMATSVAYLSIPICFFEGGGLTSISSTHLIGMKEQWKIGQTIQGKGLFFSCITFLLHLIKHGLNRFVPKIARTLRYKRPKLNK